MEEVVPRHGILELFRSASALSRDQQNCGNGMNLERITDDPGKMF